MEHNKTSKLEMIANAVEELRYVIEETSPNSSCPTSGLSLTDGIFEIASQLKRIADSLEKQNKNG